MEAITPGRTTTATPAIDGMYTARAVPIMVVHEAEEVPTIIINRAIPLETGYKIEGGVVCNGINLPGVV